MEKTQSKNWYKLDTSAKIYPAIESSRDTALFRISIALTEEVDDVLLLKALNNIKKRFPYYNVLLKQGLFWNYLQANENELLLWGESPSPCERMHPLLNNGYLYKIKYYKKNIALEVFHVLTDGFGAFEFFKCLLHQYLFLQGHVPENLPAIINIDTPPDEEEYKDAFLTVLENKSNQLPDKNRSLFSSKSVYQMNYKLLPSGQYNIITGIFSVEDTKKLAKKYNATVTQLLAALYLEGLLHSQNDRVKNKSKHKNVAIQIPVNMRKYYPFKCMRNFSLFVIPSINPRNVDNLEDIIKEIKIFMKTHLTHDHLLTMIDDNTSIAKHQFIKHIPVGIKNLFISYINNTMGSSQFSGTISNFGIVKLPKEMENFIEDIYFVTGPSPHEKSTCGAVSYKGNVYVTFGRTIDETYIEKYLFTRLVQLGVKVKIKSN